MPETPSCARWRGARGAKLKKSSTPVQQQQQQQLRRRMVGKQAPREAEEPVQVPRRREARQVPFAVIANAMDFSEEERRGFSRLPPFLRIREQKRILHNRKSQQEGWHSYGPFSPPEATALRCNICKAVVDCRSVKGGYETFNWEKARSPCQGEGAGGEPARLRLNNLGRVINDARIVERQNEKIRDFNEKAWRRRGEEGRRGHDFIPGRHQHQRSAEV